MRLIVHEQMLRFLVSGDSLKNVLLSTGEKGAPRCHKSQVKRWPWGMKSC